MSVIIAKLTDPHCTQMLKKSWKESFKYLFRQQERSGRKSK